MPQTHLELHQALSRRFTRTDQDKKPNSDTTFHKALEPEQPALEAPISSTPLEPQHSPWLNR